MPQSTRGYADAATRAHWKRKGNKVKIGKVEVTDFDIGVGWQTKGNYGSWRPWIISALHNQVPGELTKNIFGMFIVTILGFYFRVHILGPGGYRNLKGEAE